MMINTNDADLWYENYMELSPEMQEEYIVETIKNSLTQDFVDKIDIVDFIIEILDNLVDSKNYERMLELYDLIEQNNKEVLDNEIFYIDNTFIDYYLAKFQKEKLNKHLKSFIKHPIKSIDFFLPVLDKFCCYGYDDLAAEVCEKVYHKMKNSDDLLGRAKVKVSNMILMHKLQQMYSDIKNGELVDKENVIKYLMKYDQDISKHYILIIDALSVDISDFNLESNKNVETNEKDIIRSLGLYFCKYVHDEKNVSFNTGIDLWYSALENTIKNKKIKNDLFPLDKYFVLDFEKYEKNLAENYQFMVTDWNTAVKVSYGTHFVYDFLYNNALISKQTYEDCIKVIEENRKQVLKSMNKDVWRCNFVCKWNKPDSIDSSDYIDENNFIKEAFFKVIDFATYMPKNYMKFFEDIEKRIKEKEKIEQESKTIRKEISIGRNDPCPCGSGLKYKKCCGK